MPDLPVVVPQNNSVCQMKLVLSCGATPGQGCIEAAHEREKGVKEELRGLSAKNEEEVGNKEG